MADVCRVGPVVALLRESLQPCKCLSRDRTSLDGSEVRRQSSGFVDAGAVDRVLGGTDIHGTVLLQRLYDDLSPTLACIVGCAPLALSFRKGGSSIGNAPRVGQLLLPFDAERRQGEHDRRQ